MLMRLKLEPDADYDDKEEMTVDLSFDRGNRHNHRANHEQSRYFGPHKVKGDMLRNLASHRFKRMETRVEEHGHDFNNPVMDEQMRRRKTTRPHQLPPS
jgi:hypothetical protein